MLISYGQSREKHAFLWQITQSGRLLAAAYSVKIFFLGNKALSALPLQKRCCFCKRNYLCIPVVPDFKVVIFA